MSESDEMEQELDLVSGVAAFEGKHFATAERLLSPLADRGHPEALYRLAIMEQNGLGCVRRPESAVAKMRAAAEQGHALAQHGLGFMYMEGEGVPADAEEAVKWFRLAAEHGLAGSQTTLAMMYQEGRGVPQDLEEAKRWYAKAGFDDVAM